MKKIALVTGGTRGIGAAISKILQEAGYKVAANYNKDVKTAEQFREETGIPVFSWDVSDYDACSKGVATVCEALGGSIDVLVNNAGITRDGFLHKMDPQSWTEVINTNLNSVFYMCRVVVPVMREKNYGRIINISSINGLKGQAGQTNYSAAKAGIIGFSKALALECASKGITVNVIAPGYTDTDMIRSVKEEIREQIKETIPMKRFGTVAEIADAVVYLASARTGFTTGAVLSINGGQYM